MFHDRPAIPRRIIGFHQDEFGDWVAELECGHGQHVRHEPPLRTRPWVRTPEGRAAHLGTQLWCVRCADAAENGGEHRAGRDAQNGGSSPP